ncbi:MAG TPA: hypothetical protein VK927_08325, partial [Adhaeribacter sp.]|nr:hypothetical protein [Adhaeribacter sp.]
VPFEMPFLETGKVNQALAEQGYPHFDHPEVVPGFGFQSQTNRFILNFAFNKRINRKEDLNSNYETGYSSTSFAMGRDFFRNPKIALYPYVGYKTSELTYAYREKVNTTFNGYLAGSFKEKEMTNSRRNLEVGLGLAYQKVLQFGLKSGLFIPIQKESWKIHNNQVSLADMPGLKRNFYVTFFVGLGFTDQTTAEKPDLIPGTDWDTQTAVYKSRSAKKSLKRFLPFL